jgi:hypothetical protein
MNADPAAPRPGGPLPAVAGLGLLALLAVGPLMAEPRPVDFLPPYASEGMTLAAEAAVLLLMGLALAVRARLDRGTERRPGRLTVLFAALAAAMTLCHWAEVDSDPVRMSWQRDDPGAGYRTVLNREGEAPHKYRPLPYGFVRLLEEVSRDWYFAIVAYRWFFTCWFLWASYRLARLFLGPGRALLTLAVPVLLYPLSVRHYFGQPTDPLSHTLFVLSLLYLLEDRPAALAAALALGVLAKETAVIVVPAYLACYWRRGLRAWLVTACLGAACVAAFLAARLPLGWSPGYGDINGTTGLMVGTNLGFGTPIASTTVPLWENYLHPLLFVGPFLPFIAWRWRSLDPRLRALCLTLTPLLLASNVCFGWLYESRNYLPLVPLLATAAMPPGRTPVQSERRECHQAGR